MFRWLAVPVFTLLIAVCAQLTVPMAPVPMTLQTFAVLLAGAVLGGGRGASAVLAYLALGAAGLPVFSDGGSGWSALAGPTAGYLVAFPIAAGLVGILARWSAFRSALGATLLMVGGHALILGLGGAWLAAQIGVGPAIEAGVAPFVIGAAVKSIAVVIAAVGLRRLGLR